MNKKLLLLGTVLLAASVLLTNAESERTPTYQLDVKSPVVAILTGLQGVLTHIQSLINLVFAALPCLLGLLLPPEGVVVHEVFGTMNLSQKVDPRFQQELAAKLAQAPVVTLFKNFEGYCSTDDFKSIHNFVWKEDDQFSDLVRFMHRFGYTDIYDVIKGLYVNNGCPQELVDDLPPGPPPPKKTSKTHPRFTKRHQRADIRTQMFQELISPKQNDQCDIGKIIGLLPESLPGVIELIKLLNTLSKEFGTNPSLHFLMGKIQEPVKGASVRKFTRLPAVGKILMGIHQQMKDNPFWAAIFVFVKDNIGIDFNIVNPVNVILQLLIAIIWPVQA